MSYVIEIEVEHDYLVFHVMGIANLEDNIDLGAKVIKTCSDHKLEKILIDTRDLGKPTTITEMYQLGKEVAPGALKVIKKTAILHGPERTQEIQFFQTTMQNRGICINSFLDKKKAIDWLLKKL